MEINVEKNTLAVDTDTLIGKLIAGCKGRIFIKSPRIKGGKREITSVTDITDNIKAEPNVTKPKAKKASEKKSK